MLKKIFLTIISLFFLVVLSVLAKYEWDFRKTYPLVNQRINQGAPQPDLSLGKRIYHVRAGCVDCHGVDLTGAQVMNNFPMVAIFGANLTPYNLGDWSDEDLARAIRFGIHKSGRSLRFMPSFDFTDLSQGDLVSLIAYLRSQPAVKQESKEVSIGPVAKVLSALGQMPVLFPGKIIDPHKPFISKPMEAKTREFGEYLAKTCTGCHGHEFRGGPIPGGAPDWPPAASHCV